MNSTFEDISSTAWDKRNLTIFNSKLASVPNFGIKATILVTKFNVNLIFREDRLLYVPIKGTYMNTSHAYEYIYMHILDCVG